MAMGANVVLFFVSYWFTWVGTGRQKAYIGSGNIIFYKISNNATSGYGIQESVRKDDTHIPSPCNEAL